MRNFFSLVPFFIFLATFIGLNIYYPLADPGIKSDFPLLAIFIALLFSLFTFKNKTTLNDKIKVFIKGAAQESILHLCFVFLFSTMLSYTANRIGASQAAVDIVLYSLPENFILPGIFLFSSLFSVFLGTSMGTILTLMPIFLQIGQSLVINPQFIAGIVISGAMFGDNISLISDTTIAATNVTGSTMLDKLKDNLRTALPAAIAVLIILTYMNHHYVAIKPLTFLPQISIVNFFKISPYLITLVLALLGFDVLCELVAGILLAIGIGLYYQQFTFLDITELFHYGFYKSKGMVVIFMLVLFLSGLSQIVKHNGGITFLLNALGKQSKSLFRTKLEIFFLVFFVNAAVAINSLSILIVGPLASKLAENKLSFARTASILDIGSCVSQGILPYTPQVLAAATICNISPISIMPFLFYPYLLLGALLIDISIQKR